MSDDEDAEVNLDGERVELMIDIGMVYILLLASLYVCMFL